jgi:hypothetical protein
VFVDQARVAAAVDQLNGDARAARSTPNVTPVTDLSERGSSGVTAIAALTRAIDELADAVGLNLEFSATAAAGVARQAAVADGQEPS